MLSRKLVNLIERHSDALATRLLEKVHRSKYTSSYSRVPAEELKARVSEIYQNLGQWLLHRTEADLQELYNGIGIRRYGQHVALSDMVWSIVLAKQTLWEFLESEGAPEGMTDVFGELDLLVVLGTFFDRATHWAVVGYESARALDLELRLRPSAA